MNTTTKASPRLGSDSTALNEAKTVVVVGVTGAFGKVIVKRLMGERFEMLAVARDRPRLESLQRELPGLQICSTDIDNNSAIDAISDRVKQPVRAIVRGPGGGMREADLDVLNDAINIKVGGLLHYGLEPTAYAAAAGVANAALMNVVRQLSLAYGSRYVTAHTIAPRPADTERLNRVAAAMAERDQTTVHQALGTMLADSSIKSFTTPEQVACAVSTLLDPYAASMTGSTMMLGSGRRRGLP